MREPAHLVCASGSPGGAQQLAEEAARWLLTLGSAEHADRTAFVAWLKRSPRHVEEFLLTMTINDGLRRIGASRIRELIQRSRSRRRQGMPPFDEEDSSISRKLYSKYRRPLLQILLQRRIAPEAAQEMMLQAFDKAGEALRDRKLKDSDELEVHLYRLTCDLATAYWRGEIAHSHDVL